MSLSTLRVSRWMIVIASGVFVALFTAMNTASAAVAKNIGIDLIPWPKQIELGAGPGLKLTMASHIVATDPSLKPLAEILSDELSKVVGIRFSVTEGEGNAGDVILKIDPALRAGADILTTRNQQFVRVRDYAHTFVVTDRVTITGFDYRAVAEGTSTLLQSIKPDGDAAIVPPLKIKDWPAADFMAVMIDTARQDIPIESLKQAVIACRLYKVRYLQLHMSDDQGWTFPSTAYPLLGTKNTAAHGGITPRVYDLQQLKDLVAFADARGVTLVPELETAGHTGAARLAMPAIFDSIDPATGKLRGLALMNMVNPKMYQALDTIIGEACDIFHSSPYIHVGCDETNWSAIHRDPDVAAYLEAQGLKGNDYGALFLQHVRKMDAIVRKHGRTTMIWEGGANEAAKDIVVETWEGDSRNAERLVAKGFTTVTVPWNLGVPLQDWSMYVCNGSVLKPTDSVLGAMLPMWEMSSEALVNSYLPGIPDRQERTWSPQTNFTLADLEMRKAHLQHVFDQLAMPVSIVASGLDLPKDKIFYQTLHVTLKNLDGDGDIRYTLDGTDPVSTSTKYTTPIALTSTTALKAALFDADGKRISYVSQGEWKKVDYEKNLATGKPVTISGGTQEKQYAPENAVDGRTDTAWWAAPAPQWLQVDLQQPYTIDRIDVYPYFDGHRYYQYTVETSLDGKTWTRAVDMSHNTTPQTARGDRHDIKPTSMRYIRVNMLKNSANEAVHLAEIRVYEPGKHPAHE